MIPSACSFPGSISNARKLLRFGDLVAPLSLVDTKGNASGSCEQVEREGLSMTSTFEISFVRDDAQHGSWRCAAPSCSYATGKPSSFMRQSKLALTTRDVQKHVYAIVSYADISVPRHS